MMTHIGGRAPAGGRVAQLSGASSQSGNIPRLLVWFLVGLIWEATKGCFSLSLPLCLSPLSFTL